MTPREVARLLRVGPDRVRAMIVRGDLAALNLGTARRPRFVILPQHLDEFGRRRRAAADPPRAARRRRLQTPVDYYPD
jgi:excisionase family DNA binding protein